MGMFWAGWKSKLPNSNHLTEYCKNSTFQAVARSWPPLAVVSENPKPKIENGLFFLFLLWSLFFCSRSRRGTGFALFLFLRDHFRSCGCGFCFLWCSLFLLPSIQNFECPQIVLFFF